MAFWLAKRRNGQQSDFIQRFDPRFWTVDFPRPAMASVISTGPDSLRVEAEFHQADSLVGLIWDSTDRFDHPLLAYQTDRDYSRTTLSFRWRSDGVIALDATNGPTLTIEGRDSSGQPRAWFVRLWNYAKGSPEDALVTLPFSKLAGGWSPDDPVDPHAIERMFISIAPQGYRPGTATPLPRRANGWVELSAITCSGDRPMVEIGDILLPPHGLGMATAYDDSYNLTPARVLRMIRGLGYRDALIHYVGMSHYYRLDRQGDGGLVAQSGELCTPAQAWHRDFFGLCARQGYRPIASLSYELFAEHCLPAWQQRFADGSPALTGWVPPSTLLSPANGEAMSFLQRVAVRFVQLTLEAGLPVSFQIGEPWWWTVPDGRIALYDPAARALFSDPPVIADLRQAQPAEAKALLDRAGDALAASTAALRSAVIDASGGVAEVMLLLFTPTILDPAMPDLRRANLPPGWAWPDYDRLQLEDYDWLTEGADGLRRTGYATLQWRLGYPLERQDYLAGFVLDGADAETHWPSIDRAIDEAARRGVSRRFVWALPQVARDGFTRLPISQDDTMQAFDDVLYPLALGRDAGVSAEFSTSIAITASGHERRASHWTDARLHFDVGPGVRSEAELGTLIAFFRARRGAARGFRLRDPFDFSSNGMTGEPGPLDQLLTIGDGRSARFRLCKHYGADPQVRPISRPRPESVKVSVAGEETAQWTLEDGGWILFRTAPATGAEIRAGFLFDVPVRFASDRLDISAATFAAGEAPSVPLVEVREA
ncbi:TIGR02217 family protein [Croceibacterium sp. LX-88]|uniref:TIGR02217 family protein n=1 Tax=Croceibacterium selenioxidans TaxID=2838833 RepID=A0ABS5W7P8_9SPHN|nr:DUF2460 domain-containing protein [Croceibacterium selenioxidans]MBT2135117.1 TIGR02217 family protein [Croceibacterium selenioxidans]